MLNDFEAPPRWQGLLATIGGVATAIGLIVGLELLAVRFNLVGPRPVIPERPMD